MAQIVSDRIMKKPLGVYLHIPFCIKKCNYCDFCSFPGTDGSLRNAYVDALCRQISETKDKCVGYTADTLYFGGGTPTLLSLSGFEKIFTTLHNTFEISPDAEITVECNPATADRNYFAVLRSLGVNRLSIGVQSAVDSELKTLGRVHSVTDAEIAYNDARVAGFDNISCDIMFGIPGQTRQSFSYTLDRLSALEPEHISTYGLILEPETPFYDNRNNLEFPDEDTEYAMYNDAVLRLAENGLERYEISNFARPGRQSRHNLKYWRREEYLGFGVAAHSLFDEKRFSVPNSLDRYISGDYSTEPENISRYVAANEYVMLAMRLVEGVDEAEYRRRFGESFEAAFGEKLRQFVEKGFVCRSNGSCRFTDKGFYVSNSILSEILSFEG